MARVDKEIIINSSIERIYDYISDPSNWPEFWPSLIEVEDIQPLPNGGFKAKYEYKMAGMDGAEIFRQIREINDSVPVVIITGYPMSGLMEQALEQGPIGVMRKPFSALDIARSADSFLRGVKAKDKVAERFQKLGYLP